MPRRHSLLIAVPFGCNTDCVFCGRNESHGLAGEKPSPRAIDFRRLEKVLDAFAALPGAAVNIGGDEPTVLPDRYLFRLLAAIKRRGFAAVELRTNGLKLASRPYLRRLLAAGVTAFRVSIYGATPAVQDAVVGRPGSFRKLRAAFAGLKALLPPGKVRLATLRLKQNERQLPALRKLAASLGFRLEEAELQRQVSRMDYAPFRPSGRAALPQGTVLAPPSRYMAEYHYNLHSGVLNKIN